MPKPRRSNDWGFPRWRGYESERAAANVKLCDRHGCEEVGDCPAPKAPNSRDRWYFCQRHAAEYNQKWDYFEGLDKAEKAARAKAETAENAGYADPAVKTRICGDDRTFVGFARIRRIGDPAGTARGHGRSTDRFLVARFVGPEIGQLDARSGPL